MKKLSVSLAIATAVAFVLVSCALFSDGQPSSSSLSGSSTTTGGAAIYGKEFWGEWVRMDANDTWYIASDHIKINGSKKSKNLSLSKQSDKIIKVSEGGKEYYLYANRTPTATVSGKVATFDESSRSASTRSVAGGKGWIQVAVENISNTANSTTVTTDGSGNFTVSGIIPGDSYTVTPQGGKPVTVRPNGNGDNVGTVTVTQGVNFKTSITALSRINTGYYFHYTDIDHLFATKANSSSPYQLKLSIKNEGDAQCTAATCEITWDSDLHITFYDEDYRLLKTIEPGKTKEIELNVWCDEIAAEAEYKKITIKITDQETKKVYEDSVSLRFFKSNLNLNFASQDGVSAFVIAPTGKLYYVRNTKKDSLVLPHIKGDYYVAFSGATAATETRYSLGVNSYIDTTYTNFVDLFNYEPNNLQTTATTLQTGQKIMSYLHKNDIDFYLISLSGNAPAPRPVTVVGQSTSNYEYAKVSQLTPSIPKNYNGSIYFMLMSNFRNIYYGSGSGELNVKIDSSSSYVSFSNNIKKVYFSGYYDSYRFSTSYYGYIFCNAAFSMKLSENCPVGEDLPFTLTFTDKNGNTWTDEIVVPVAK